MNRHTDPEHREHRRVHPAGAFKGMNVKNPAGNDLGNIEDIAVDTESGRIAYAVLSFGGFLGMGDKLFAVPWESLELTIDNGSMFTLDVTEERLKEAPGFDKNHWPDMGDAQWGQQVHAHYGRTPYWEKTETPSSRPDRPPSA